MSDFQVVMAHQSYEDDEREVSEDRYVCAFADYRLTSQFIRLCQDENDRLLAAHTPEEWAVILRRPRPNPHRFDPGWEGCFTVYSYQDVVVATSISCDGVRVSYPNLESLAVIEVSAKEEAIEEVYEGLLDLDSRNQVSIDEEALRAEAKEICGERQVN